MALDGENEKKYKIKQKKWHRQGEVIKDSITVQDNRNVIKAEVADAYRRQNSLEEQLRKVEETEHALTQKVYFELTGTPKEIEQLKQASEQKKAIGNLLEDLKNQILNKQEIYKNVAEKQLVKDGILENVKFSRKMKPEAVDDLESTIRNLHEKYGIMPKAVVYSPVKVENATATYNWIDDTIYISNNFNDPDKYLEQVRKSEHSLVEYNEHHDIKRKAEQRHNEVEKILADKSVKGYEREKARIQKVEAEIQLNEKRAAVRENVTDCFVHEYGHFIHRHAEVDYVQNVVDVTFPNMSAQVDKFAQSALKASGLSETMAKKYTGTFGAMAKAFGFNEQQAYDMGTALTSLTADVASFYNLSQDEAYTKLKSVFTGETESLKDLGVVMTQTALDSYALANGYGKTTAQMTEAEKVSLRYAFVQQQLSAASGDFARTSGSWANQVRVLKLQIDSLKASIGQGLINLFTPIIQTVNNLLGKLVTLANAFKAFTELITGKKNSGSSGGGSAQIAAAGTAATDASTGLQNAADAANDTTYLEQEDGIRRNLSRIWIQHYGQQLRLRVWRRVRGNIRYI